MIIDYEFYTNIYQGNKLTEDNFNKYIGKGLNIISRYTMDRVRENTINSFPQPLLDNIKKCACELAEFMYDVSRLESLGVSSALAEDTLAQKPIKSMSAGAVSYTIDTNLSNNISKDYIDRKSINNRYRTILNEYLYPQCIGCEYYNLLSWVGRGC